jgi:hypothetical protein
MNEATLRAWVRKELPPEERREVTRWMIRCTDPALPLILHGMVRELEESPVDAALAAMGRVWSQIVEGWNQLVDLGFASWSDQAQGQIVVASADPSAPGSALSVTEAGGAWLVEVSGEIGATVQIYLTDAAGLAQTAVEGTIGEDGWLRETIELPDTVAVTLWAAIGETLREASSAADALADALADDATAVYAWRRVQR